MCCYANQVVTGEEFGQTWARDELRAIDELRVTILEDAMALSASFRNPPLGPEPLGPELVAEGQSEIANRVADGTRTRNSQNHNLELYH